MGTEALEETCEVLLEVFNGFWWPPLLLPEAAAVVWLFEEADMVLLIEVEDPCALIPAS